MKRNQIITIISRKGAGKSVMMQYLTLLNPKSCFIFDPTGSLEPFKNRVIFDYEIYGDSGFKKLCNKIGTRLYYQKIDIVIRNCENVENILEIIYYNMQGVAIVIDEIDLCYKPFISNESILYKLCNFGRHKEIDLIGVARRPANVPRALTSQSDFIFLGIHNKEPRDESYLKEFISKQALNDYNSIALYEFLKIDLTKHNHSKIRLSQAILNTIGVK